MPYRTPTLSLKRKGPELTRPSSAVRGYGRSWAKVSKSVLNEEPICRYCVGRGRVTPSKQVDHAIPRKAGGSEERSNLQGLCTPHHAAKTRREASGRIAPPCEKCWADAITSVDEEDGLTHRYCEAHYEQECSGVSR